MIRCNVDNIALLLAACDTSLAAVRGPTKRTVRAHIHIRLGVSVGLPESSGFVLVPHETLLQVIHHIDRDETWGHGIAYMASMQASREREAGRMRQGGDKSRETIKFTPYGLPIYRLDDCDCVDWTHVAMITSSTPDRDASPDV